MYNFAKKQAYLRKVKKDKVKEYWERTGDFEKIQEKLKEKEQERDNTILPF